MEYRQYGLSFKNVDNIDAFVYSGFSADFPVVELPLDFIDDEAFISFNGKYGAESVYVTDMIAPAISRCMYEQTPGLMRDFVDRFAELGVAVRERGVKVAGADFYLESIGGGSPETLSAIQGIIRRCAAALYGRDLTIAATVPVFSEDDNYAEKLSVFMRDMMIPGVGAGAEAYLSDTLDPEGADAFFRWMRFDLQYVKLVVMGEDLICDDFIVPWLDCMDRYKIKCPLIFQMAFAGDEAFFRAVEKIRAVLNKRKETQIQKERG